MKQSVITHSRRIPVFVMAGVSMFVKALIMMMDIRRQRFLGIFLVIGLVNLAPAHAKILSAPVFEAFVVEKDGSMVVHGQAIADGHMELMNGAALLGKAQADKNGAFHIRVKKPLKSGEYALVLRSTDPDGKSATSVQTLVVSVPDGDNTHVLALIDEPGRERRLISDHIQPQPETSLQEAAKQNFAIEQITYDKGRFNVLGKSPAGMRVSVIIRERTIGSELSDKDGRFSIDRTPILAQGDYIVKADLVAGNGQTVVTIQVPFSLQAKDGLNVQRYRCGKPVETIKVRYGETLSQIAVRLYKDGAAANAIFEANRDVLKTPNAVIAGQELVLPFGLKGKKD